MQFLRNLACSIVLEIQLETWTKSLTCSISMSPKIITLSLCRLLEEWMPIGVMNYTQERYSMKSWAICWFKDHYSLSRLKICCLNRVAIQSGRWIDFFALQKKLFPWSQKEISMGKIRINLLGQILGMILIAKCKPRSIQSWPLITSSQTKT